MNRDLRKNRLVIRDSEPLFTTLYMLPKDLPGSFLLLSNKFNQLFAGSSSVTLFDFKAPFNF